MKYNKNILGDYIELPVTKNDQRLPDRRKVIILRGKQSFFQTLFTLHMISVHFEFFHEPVRK